MFQLNLYNAINICKVEKKTILKKIFLMISDYCDTYNQLSRVLGRVILVVSALANRKFFSKRILLYSYFSRTLWRNWQIAGESASRPFSSTTNYQWRTNIWLYSIIVNEQIDWTTLFPFVFSVAWKLYKLKLKDD